MAITKRKNSAWTPERRAAAAATAKARFAGQTIPPAGGSGERPIVPPQEDGVASNLANEVAAILNQSIVRGGIKLADDSDDDQEDSRDDYTQQSYANDPVHEEYFDPRTRDSGPLHLPVEQLEIDGTTYKLGYKLCKIAGQVATEALSRAALDGWVPVPLDKLPGTVKSFAFKSDLGDNFYIIRDVILMMIPLALHERIERRNQNMRNRLMARVDDNAEFLNALTPNAGIEPRAQTPTRQTFSGRTATAAVQDALESAAAQTTAARAHSPHQLRGFRVR